MTKSKRVILIIVAALLVLALAVTAFTVQRQRKVIQEQEKIIELGSAYCYMRDVYLKCNAVDRGAKYPILTQLGEFLSFDDPDFEAINSLIVAVRSVSPDDPYLDELSEKLDGLKFFLDTRGDTYSVSLDVEAAQELIAEINEHVAE